MRIDIWSDLVCPWCYVGKRRLERALAAFPNRDTVQIVHRVFQLNPGAPKGATSDRRAHLMSKYGWSETQAEAIDAHMERTAAAAGLEFHLAGGVTGNTFDAHRLVLLAGERGMQDRVLERFYRAYFTEQRSLFDHGSLMELAADAGFDADEVRCALAGEACADTVATDGAEARLLGVTGVPFILFDRCYAISGAQSLELFSDALAWASNGRAALLT